MTFYIFLNRLELLYKMHLPDLPSYGQIWLHYAFSILHKIAAGKIELGGFDLICGCLPWAMSGAFFFFCTAMFDSAAKY